MLSSPTKIWRYSRIAELDLDRFAPATPHTVVVGGDQLVAEIDEVMWSAGKRPTVRRAEHRVHGPCSSCGFRRLGALAEPIVVTHTVSWRGCGPLPAAVIDAGATAR